MTANTLAGYKMMQSTPNYNLNQTPALLPSRATPHTSPERGLDGSEPYVPELEYFSMDISDLGSGVVDPEVQAYFLATLDPRRAPDGSYAHDHNSYLIGVITHDGRFFWSAQARHHPDLIIAAGLDDKDARVQACQGYGSMNDPDGSHLILEVFADEHDRPSGKRLARFLADHLGNDIECYLALASGSSDPVNGHSTRNYVGPLSQYASVQRWIPD